MTTNDKANTATRREFLKAATLSGAAFAAGPLVLTSRSSHAADVSVMGVGEHQYEWEGDWAKLPASREFGYTHAILEDSQGRIFIHCQYKDGGQDSVLIFDADGKFMNSWGKEFGFGGHGMQLSIEDGQEFLYLAATVQHKIAKTTLDGELVWEMGYPEEPGVYRDEKRFVPTNIAIAANGDFYVADGYGSHYVHQYNKDAEYIRTFGGPGTSFDKLKQPHGIWIDTRGRREYVAVADRGKQRIAYFSMDGKFIRQVKSTVHTPCHIDQRGEYLLVPELWGRVTILDGRNKPYARLGTYEGVRQIENYPNIANELRLPGKFSSPHDAMWDREGNLFVAEWISDGRITKLRHIT